MGLQSLFGHCRIQRFQIKEAGQTDRTQISELPSDYSHKTLGHFKSPTDKYQRQQLAVLAQKAKQVSLLISAGPVTRQGALLSYHSIFLPTVQYPLPQSFFSQHALLTQERKTMGSILSKCGFNRCTPTVILYGPLSYAGGGFVHWYTLQGEGQVKIFWKHWRTNSIVSDMLRIAVSWAQWQAGTGRSILEDTRTPLPYLECRWLTSMRAFLHHIEATVEVDTPFVQGIERDGDQHIMDYVSQSPQYSSEDARIINYCRLYLHVTTISE